MARRQVTAQRAVYFSTQETTMKNPVLWALWFCRVQVPKWECNTSTWESYQTNVLHLLRFSDWNCMPDKQVPSSSALTANGTKRLRRTPTEALISIKDPTNQPEPRRSSARRPDCPARRHTDAGPRHIRVPRAIPLVRRGHFSQGRTTLNHPVQGCSSYTISGSGTACS